MNRRTARRANGRRGRCSLSHRLRAIQSRTWRNGDAPRTRWDGGPESSTPRWCERAPRQLIRLSRTSDPELSWTLQCDPEHLQRPDLWLPAKGGDPLGPHSYLGRLGVLLSTVTLGASSLLLAPVVAPLAATAVRAD